MVLLTELFRNCHTKFHYSWEVGEKFVYCLIEVNQVSVAMEEDGRFLLEVAEKMEIEPGLIEHWLLVFLQRLSQLLRVIGAYHYGRKIGEMTVQRNVGVGELLAMQPCLCQIEFAEH